MPRGQQSDYSQVDGIVTTCSGFVFCLTGGHVLRPTDIPDILVTHWYQADRIGERMRLRTRSGVFLKPTIVIQSDRVHETDALPTY